MGGQCQPLSRQGARRDRVRRARAPDARGEGTSSRRRAMPMTRTQSRPQAAEVDIAERSRLGLDSQGQQAQCSSAMDSIISSTLRTRSLLTLKPTPARTYDEVEFDKDDARSHRAALRPEAEAACGRHCLWDWPLPGLAGWPQDCTAHPGPRCQRARRRHILAQ